MLTSCQLKDVGSIEFLPDFIEGLGEVFFHPGFRLLGKLECRCDPMLFEKRGGLRPDTPDVLDRELGEVAMQLPDRDDCKPRRLLPLGTDLGHHLIWRQTY